MNRRGVNLIPIASAALSMPACRTSDFDVLVVGAGLAGSAVAHVLAERGYRVGVLEKRAEVARAASGNPAGVLIPYLTRTLTFEAQFYARAWERILNWPLFEEARTGRRGAIHLAHNPGLEERFAIALKREGQRKQEGKNQEKSKEDSPESGVLLARAIDRHEASELAGLPVNYGGLFYPDGGLVSPRLLCRLCLSHKRIVVLVDTRVEDATWLSKEKCWRLKSRTGSSYKAPFLVLANAHDAALLRIASWLPIYSVRGQILFLRQERSTQNLRYPLSYDGYLTPTLSEGFQIVGASFEHWNKDPNLSPEQNEAILGLAAGCLPELAKSRPSVFSAEGRVAFRSTSHDRFPVIGALADFEALRCGIAEDSRQRHEWSLRWPWDLSLPQVYVSLAHASRGILSSLLSAEVIADEIEGRSAKLSRDVLRALSSARFLRRRFRKTGTLGIS